jgi:response regulator of citrate/malate metabolism
MTGKPPLKVLIVEDEVLLAVELEYLVKSYGAQPVGHAMTSPEAIALAQQLRPDLALVDVHLSDGPTGIDAARQMTDHCGAVVLFITANVKRLPEDYAGACGAMSKPYTEHGVRTALAFLDECLRQGRATRPPPQGLTLAPSYALRWSVNAAA